MSARKKKGFIKETGPESDLQMARETELVTELVSTAPAAREVDLVTMGRFSAKVTHFSTI